MMRGPDSFYAWAMVSVCRVGLMYALISDVSGCLFLGTSQGLFLKHSRPQLTAPSYLAFPLVGGLGSALLRRISELISVLAAHPSRAMF